MRAIMTRETDDLPGLIKDLLVDMTNGHIKMFLIHRALAVRNQHPLLFQEGDYLPLEISPPEQKHLIAFARQHGSEIVVTLTPRLLSGWLEDGALPLGREIWADTAVQLPNISGVEWKDAFTGRRITAASSLEVGAILDQFPVGLLVGSLTSD